MLSNFKRLKIIREKIITGLLFFLHANFGYGQTLQGDGLPPTPKQNSRSDNFQTNNYPYSWESLEDNFSEKVM